MALSAPAVGDAIKYLPAGAITAVDALVLALLLPPKAQEDGVIGVNVLWIDVSRLDQYGAVVMRSIDSVGVESNPAPTQWDPA
jgi:hypothetical protein